ARSARYVCCSSRISGIALRQGPPHVAQKSISTTLPVRSGLVVRTSSTTNSGAALPRTSFALSVFETILGHLGSGWLAGALSCAGCGAGLVAFCARHGAASADRVAS